MTPRTSGAYRAIAAYYDAEYAQDEMLQRDVPFLLHHLPKRRCDILEVAVGTGRAAIPLAQAGHRVVGIDYDPAVLDIACEKRDAMGIPERKLALHRMDATQLALGRTFDRVVLLFNTLLNFSTLDKLDGLLAGVSKHLKRSGRFWIDIFNPDPTLLTPGPHKNLDGTMFHVPHLDRSVHRSVEIETDATMQQQKVTFLYRWFDARGAEKTERIRFISTFLFPREVRLLLERHDMEIEEQWGDHDGSPLESESPRIIVSAKRRR